MERKKKMRFGVLVALFTLMLAVVAFVFFYMQVNTKNLPREYVVSSLGETVNLRSYDTYMQTGKMEIDPNIEFAAEKACLVKPEVLKDEYPDVYRQLIIEQGAQDYLLLVVKGEVANTSDDDIQTMLGEQDIQIGTYANGMNPVAFQSLNSEVQGATLKGQTRAHVFLPFAIYEVSFGLNDAWKTMNTQNYQLVSQVYPSKRSFDLGVPQQVSSLKSFLEE